MTKRPVNPFDRIRAELRGFPRGQVTRFLDEVDRALIAQRCETWWKEVSATECHKIERLCGAIATTLGEISGPWHTLSSPPYSRRQLLDTTSEKVESADNKFFDALWAAHDALTCLRTEVVLAQRRRFPSRKSLRPRADPYAVAARLAEAYFISFRKRPTKTLNGPFSNVISIVLETSSGKARRDVSRVVRAAIDHMTI